MVDMKRVYLDYAATTPLDREVLHAMKPYLMEKFGNPSSLHLYGQEALSAVDKSRETIARACGTEFRGVIFTGSATEANNLALRGVVRSARNVGIQKPRIIATTIEHESILKTCNDLERDGIDVVYLPVDKAGVVHIKKLRSSLNKNTILVSVGYVNNEIGTVQPIQEIAKIICDTRADGNYPLLHTDAVQAFQYFDCDMQRLGVDMMTISAHKMYGPKGIGTLVMSGLHDRKGKIKNNILSPIVYGGGQEFGMRSGTENVAHIVGFAKAVDRAAQIREKEARRVMKIRDYCIRALHHVHGCPIINYRATRSAPHIVTVAFRGISSEELVVALDLHGIAVSAGSACSMRSLEQSYVLQAIGAPQDSIDSNIRISFGRMTTLDDVQKLVRAFKKIAGTA